MTTSLLLVDDHAVFVETLAQALRANAAINVVAVCMTGADALEKATKTKPEVALIDMSLPDTDGIELVRKIRRVSPDTKMVILTGSDDPAFFVKAMEAGVSGYLMKSVGLAEVSHAVAEAKAGRVVVPEGVIGKILTPAAPASGLGSDLTKRELEVLALLGEGCDTKRVAKTLGITWQTSRSYVKNILFKLDAHTQVEAVTKAIRMGLLTPRTDG